MKEKYWRGKLARLLVKKSKEADQAQTPDEVGGINLNDKHLTINIKVDGDGMPLPVQFQDAAMVNIQGLSPVIRGITSLDVSNVPALAELMK